MSDILYYGAVAKLQTEQILVVEYRFTCGTLPIAVHIIVHRSHNDATYEQLVHEAVSYARMHCAMVEEIGGNN